LIQKTGIGSIEGQAEKVIALIDYMWNWLDEKSILDYRHPEYGGSMLHSILYGFHSEQIGMLVNRFIDLWDSYYLERPLPEIQGDEGEDPQTIEYLLAYEILPDQLERVLRRPGYTSGHLKWLYHDYHHGLIGTKTKLVYERDRWRNTYDVCIRMLEDMADMPSDVDPVVLKALKDQYD